MTTTPDPSTDPSLVSTGAYDYVAYVEDPPGAGGDIYVKVVGSTTSLVSDSDSFSSIRPNLAWDGANFSLTWLDARTGPYEVFFDPAAFYALPDIRITTSGVGDWPRHVWTGSELVATYSSSGVRDVSLDTGGALEHRILTTDSGGFPALAAGARGLGLAYEVSTTIRFVGLGCGPVDTTPPPCPAAPQEVGRTTTPSHTVTLAWGPSVDPESELSHYRIYRDGVALAITAAPPWTDTTFDPAVGYVYWIEAVNGAGLGSGGCASVDTSDTVPPACPGNLLATNVTQTSATLSWLPAMDAKSGVRQYRIYRNNVPLATVPAGTTTYTDGTLVAGTTYNFAILAEDWAGNLSPACATASVWISTSPITLYLSKLGDGIHAKLDWNDVGLNEYVVFRSTSPQASTEHERVPVSQTTDPVLQDGVQLWCYYIQQKGL